MKIDVNLRDQNKALKDLERAESLVKEAAEILRYNLCGAFTLEIREQPSAATNDCSED